MAASNPIKLAVDRQNGVLLTQLALFASALPTFNQGDVRDLVIQVFDPGGVTGASAPVDMTGYSMRVTLGIPGGSGASTIYAGPLAMAYNAGSIGVTGNTVGYFSGSLDLTGAGLTAVLPPSILGSSVNVQLEIDVRLNGVTQCLLQAVVAIASVVDQPNTTNNPLPANSFATIPEGNQMYLRKVGTTADQKIWISPDGTKACLQYWGNDGQMHYDPINPAPLAQA